MYFVFPAKFPAISLSKDNVSSFGNISKADGVYINNRDYGCQQQSHYSFNFRMLEIMKFVEGLIAI
jgi:hypothetical protein